MTTNNRSDILASLPERISDIVIRGSESSYDWVALAEASGSWSYHQLALAVSDAQNWLGGLGVRPGDRVMIVCENCRTFAAILFALVQLKAWPVLVNARLSARELDEIRDHCGARLVIYTSTVSPHAAEHARRHGAVTHEVKTLGRIDVSPPNEKAQAEPAQEDRTNQVGALIYTSGTTGLPKGIMLTQANLLFVAAVSAKIRAMTPKDRMYGVLPMSHAVGLSVVLLGTLLTGATLYLTARFDPVSVLKALEKDHITILLGTPAMFAMLLEYASLKGLKSLNFPALRIISSSGAPLQATIKTEVEKLFGLVLHNGYGVTECSPTIAQTRIETPRTDTSVGEIFPGVEVKLVGPDGKPVDEGEVGELWVRGPNVMKGYYRAPEETAAAINSEGWFNTRDLARMESGNLFIVGRTKELIVRFGLNVYPAEIEAVLHAHPAVERAGVVGRAIEGNEEILAFVQLLPDSTVTAEELAQYAAQNLASHKLPSEIYLVPLLPTTPTGKVMKHELEKMAPVSC